jgi:hypothetical protein
MVPNHDGSGPIFINMIKKFSPFLLIAFLIVSCDAGLDGNLAENKPPRTSLTINSINLPEGDRLNSQINISWWGDDPDGFVVGYEIFIGDGFDSPGAVWTFTTKTDSTFILPIEQGEIDADVRFTVRAVDNEDLRDPNPPSLVFPIRNSPPEITFVSTETPPDTTFNIFSFGFRASDPDGAANLNRVEIALNDTTCSNCWKALDPNTQLLTFRTDDQGVTTALAGRALIQTDVTFDSQIQWNAENTFHIRSFDNAGAVSAVRSHTWYVKEQKSRILFLNDYFGPNSEIIAELHLGILRDIGFETIDYLDISDGTATGGRRVVLSSAFPDRSLGAPTINKMLAEWDHIYWVSDNLDRNIGYAIELTLEFFRNGGTMFVNIPTKVLFDDNPVLEFLPFERVQPVPQGQQSFIIQNNSLVTATPQASSLPYLRFRRNLIATFPIVPFGETVELFEAPFRVRNVVGQLNDFDGSRLISAMNPEQNMLFFGIDLSEFDRDQRTVTQSGQQVVLPGSDLSGLLRYSCIDILGFQQ